MRKTILLAILLGVSVTPYMAVAETDYREWQINTIHSPTPKQLALERRGRVTIYDGLRDSDVERALDAQFDRVENMMFIRTVITDGNGEPLRNEDTGEEVVEDDDC